MNPNSKKGIRFAIRKAKLADKQRAKSRRFFANRKERLAKDRKRFVNIQAATGANK